MGRKEGMQTVLEMKQKWKKFSAMRKTKVQNGKYFFEREEETREMVKNLDEKGIRNGTMVTLYQKILKYWKTIWEAWKLDEGRPSFGKTRKLNWSLFGSEAGRLRGME